MPETLLSVRGLRVYYRGLRGLVRAVDGVDLDVFRHELIGVVGESGSGKTTLAMAILRLLPPRVARIVSGSILFNGMDLVRASEEELRRIRWSKISYVPQAALNALNPVLKIADHFLETARAHGVYDREKVLERASELLEMLRLEPRRVLNSYPHELSGGMRQRVLIALSMLFNPDLIILDEPTTALDVLTQRFILDLLRDLKKKTGVTMMFITHDIAIIADIGDRIAVMYAGKIMEVGTVDQVFYSPAHPYTQALIKSIPKLTGPIEEMRPIPGSPPDLVNPPPGCRFHPRCPYARPECSREEPPTVEVEPGHIASCWLLARR